jgi:hypothetical protein
MGLTQIKFIGGKAADALLRHAPYKNYAELQALCDETGTGISVRILESLNAVGAAAFKDNPRTGKENENFFTYLSLPTFDAKDIPPVMYAQFRPLQDYVDDDVFVCMGIVGGDKKKPTWRLLDIVDDTAAASAFVEVDSDIQVGQVYVFLIANNSVVKYITTEEIVNNVGGQFQEFLEATQLDIPEGKFRVIAFNSRKTRAGDKMADVVIADSNKEMMKVLVWPRDYGKAHTHMKEGTDVSIVVQELDNGDYAVHTINIGDK